MIEITYSQTPRPCVKKKCSLCQSGKAHPAYWFATTFLEGMERHLFLGEEFRPVTLKEFSQPSSKHVRPQYTPKQEPADAFPPLPTSKEFRRDLKKFKNVRIKDVKIKYRELIKKYHPDQYGENDVEVQEWMKIINSIHETHLNKMQRIIR